MKIEKERLDTVLETLRLCARNSGNAEYNNLMGWKLPVIYRHIHLRVSRVELFTQNLCEGNYGFCQQAAITLKHSIGDLTTAVDTLKTKAGVVANDHVVRHMDLAKKDIADYGPKLIGTHLKIHTQLKTTAESTAASYESYLDGIDETMWDCVLEAGTQILLQVPKATLENAYKDLRDANKEYTSLRATFGVAEVAEGWETVPMLITKLAVAMSMQDMCRKVLSTTDIKTLRTWAQSFILTLRALSITQDSLPAGAKARLNYAMRMWKWTPTATVPITPEAAPSKDEIKDKDKDQADEDTQMS
jgi:hypothetical protein